MKKLSFSLLLLLLSALTLLNPQVSFANRGGAADIAYKWISDSTYLVTYTFYKDCAGATAEPNTVNVCYYNTCNLDRGNITLSKKTPLVTNGIPVDPACSGNISTTCSLPAGVLRGYRKWVYEGTVILKSKCDSWHFAVSLGLRNGAITNYTIPAASNNIYVEATLNNVDAPTSSSPSFSLPPIAYMCTGVKQHFFYEGTDVDGDILSYSLIDPASAPDNQLACTYPPGPTSYVFAGGALGGTSLATNPFATGSSFNLDGTTGTMSFTPAAAQTPQLALLVTKRRGTKVVGSVIRDMQFVVSAGCAVLAPTTLTIDYLGSTGAFNAAMLTPGPGGAPTKGVYVCPNFTHTIKYNIQSISPSASITILGDNHTTFSATSASSTNTFVNGGTNNVAGTLTWKPDETDEGQRYLVIKSKVCFPNANTVYRLDTIPIYTGITTKITASDTMICFGEISNLCANPTTYPGTTFDWSTTVPGSGMPSGGIGISTATSSCTDVFPSTTTSYLVTTNHPSYCARTEPGKTALTINQDEIKVVVVNPKIDVGPDTTMCSYSTLKLNANLINPQPELTYKYSWTPTSYLDDPSLQSPSLKFPDTLDASTIPDSITFYLTVTPYPDTTCKKYDTVVVHVLKGFYLLTGDTLGAYTGLGFKNRQKGVSDTAICDGKSISLLGWGDPRYNYVWTPSAGVSTPTDFKTGMTITPTSTTTYTLTATRNGCRDSSKILNIVVEPNPTVDLGDNRTICFGDTIHTDATITPSPDVFTQYTYLWTPGGSLSRADTLANYFTGYKSENIRLIVTTPAGCSGEDNVNYLVEHRNFLSKGADTSICPGDKVHISVTGDAFLTGVTWKPQNTLDSIHSLVPLASPNYTTKYVVIGTDENNCIDSTAVTVTVLPRAVIYLPDSITIYAGDSVRLEPRGNGMSFTWSPIADMSNPDIPNPYVAPLINTTFYVTTLTDYGCTAKDSVYVFVKQDADIDVPNAFTPGRGYENSVFKPSHAGLATLKSFVVYNRWGDKMFESKDFESGWDGNLNGQPQPMGVYVYTLEAVTAKGSVVKKTGNVTLIR